VKNPAEGKNIVIIGSGVGGLSTGIILSLLNYSVTVVEKNPLSGGLMRSYRRGGIDCPVGVHYVGALGANEPLGKMFHILGIPIEDLFTRMGESGIIDRYIFEDFVFDLPVSIDAFERNIKSAFPAEITLIDVFMKNLREIAGRMLDPAFLINQGDPFQNMDFFQPMGEFLDKFDASAGLRAVLAVPCQLIGVQLVECPVIFHHMVLAGYLFSSWRLKVSGSTMADVFTRRFQELGGKLILNDGCDKIILDEGEVAGVRLNSGTNLGADTVVAAVHPKILLNLLEPDALKSSYRQRIANLKETEGVVAVQISVDASAHPEIDHNIYQRYNDEKELIKDGIFYQLRQSNDKDVNLISIFTRSLYSEWSKWENTISGKRGKDYEEKKLSIGQDLLQKANEVFGSLKNARILDVFTPLTLRDYVNCPEGSCYGVMRSSAQLLKIASLSKPLISGLFLAGQNAVAPGVLGTILGSFNAVRQIIGASRFAEEIKWEA
jgi:phytoene dehydrogenase-like protein